MSNKKKAVVFLADGLEECEGLLVVDILRRAKVEVTTASIMDQITVVSSHRIPITADAFAADLSYEDVDLIVLPGGLPGTDYLGASEIVKKQCIDFAAAEGQGKWMGAICAAPSVFAKLGLLKGRKATSHGAFEEDLCDAGAEYLYQPVVVDGNRITSRGLGTGIDFALELVTRLVDQKTAEDIAEAIHYQR